MNAAGTGPGDSASRSAVWSADGSVVAFSSTSHDLTAGGDWNDASEDVYVRDLDTGVTTLESPHPPSDFACCTMVDALSADGTKVLFHSMVKTLTSLPAGNFGYDYFLRDRVAGTTTVVSVAASGEATGNDDSGESWHRALMTPDGNKVAFESDASNLVFPPVYTTGSDIFVRDLTTGTTIHVAANVEQLRGLSDDGTRVLFSTREALVPGDGNGVNGWDLYLADLASGTTVLVSANADGTATGAPPAEGTLAPGGDGVLFVSSSSDVVPGVDTNGVDDVYLRDLATGTVRLVSSDAAGTRAMGGADGRVSPDGSRALFRSDGDLYVKDLATGGVDLVTRRTEDTIGFTGDSRMVVFTTDAADLGPVDENGIADVYARDVVSGATHLVSAGPDGTSAGGVSSSTNYRMTTVSPAGRRVLFHRGGEVYAATLPLADAAVTGSVDATGGALTYHLRATNHGPDPVEGLDLVFVVPEGTSISGATASRGTCEEVQERVVTCALGAAEPGAAADVAVSATVQAWPAGPHEAIALVASGNFDADDENDMVTLTSNAG